MSAAEKAAAWAEGIALDDSHGYDQRGRWGPDYDCSSLVISAYKLAGLDLESTYTGNMRADMLAHGFRDVTKSVDLASGAGLVRGDVLLNERSHTALYTGGGRLVHASGNERGGAVGGRTGDQTGREIGTAPYYNFPWDCVLRYAPEADRAGSDLRIGPEEESAPRRDEGVAPCAEENTYTVKPGDSLWAIAACCLGDGTRYDELRRLNGLGGYTIHPGQVLRLPGRDRKSVTLSLRAAVWENMERRAADRGKTVAALLEELFAPAP